MTLSDSRSPQPIAEHGTRNAETNSEFRVPSAEFLDACWSRIGVDGDGSCPELAAHVHCRNCPVYARAGALLLNRPLPADYRRAWTAHYANAKRGTGNGESGSAFRVPGSAFNRTSVTLFRLGPEWLALETTLFQEVAEHRLLHSLPHRRQGVVLGLVNVRGELLICISLARLLALEDDAPPGRARPLPPRLMVVSADANRFAFPVDEVYGVHRFNREELQEPPATVARAGRAVSRGVFRWQAHTVGYLDSEALCANVNRSLS